jgi:broad specificity phosphatase PhoE
MRKIRLALVRHGETIGHSSIRYYGRTDLSLSDLGRKQMQTAAQALANHFGFKEFDRVFSSPLERAYESARIIAGRSAVISRIADLVEIDFGDFEGLTAAEICSQFPLEYERWQRERLTTDYRYPAGESRAAFIERVEHGLAKMLAEIDSIAGDIEALLVAHRGVIRAITRHLTGAEPIIDLGSIQLLTYRELNWHVEVLDFTDHLAQS